jgi:hypothetical protein
MGKLVEQHPGAPRVKVDHNITVEPERPAPHALGPALVGQHAGQVG